MNELAHTCLTKSNLFERITDRTVVAGVIGLGYVGLPLAAAIARAGFRTIGFDIDPAKPEFLCSGCSYIDAVSSQELTRLLSEGYFGCHDRLHKACSCRHHNDLRANPADATS
jgi:UDP-N-acetyl-D-glucosamine dehydrogenase